MYQKNTLRSTQKNKFTHNFQELNYFLLPNIEIFFSDQNSTPLYNYHGYRQFKDTKVHK
jgi:hypothetical protein